MRKITYNDAYIPMIAKIHEEIPLQYGGEAPTTLDIALRQASLELLMQFGDTVIVLEQDELIGFIWYKIDKNLHIKSLWVAPEFRKQGFATALKNYAYNEAVKHHCRKIYGDVDAGNTAMIQLNKKLGYTLDEHHRMTRIIEVQSD